MRIKIVKNSRISFPFHYKYPRLRLKGIRKVIKAKKKKRKKDKIGKILLKISFKKRGARDEKKNNNKSLWISNHFPIFSLLSIRK